jgi:hypothetical protein
VSGLKCVGFLPQVLQVDNESQKLVILRLQKTGLGLIGLANDY